MYPPWQPESITDHIIQVSYIIDTGFMLKKYRERHDTTNYYCDIAMG